MDDVLRKDLIIWVATPALLLLVGGFYSWNLADEIETQERTVTSYYDNSQAGGYVQFYRDGPDPGKGLSAEVAFTRLHDTVDSQLREVDYAWQRLVAELPPDFRSNNINAAINVQSRYVTLIPQAAQRLGVSIPESLPLGSQQRLSQDPALLSQELASIYLYQESLSLLLPHVTSVRSVVAAEPYQDAQGALAVFRTHIECEANFAGCEAILMGFMHHIGGLQVRSWNQEPIDLDDPDLQRLQMEIGLLTPVRDGWQFNPIPDGEGQPNQRDGDSSRRQRFLRRRGRGGT